MKIFNTRMNFKKFMFATAVGVFGFSIPVYASKTVDAIKARGVLACGVPTGTPGFGVPDANGNWSGLHVDICRALAAATLGDAEKVKYIPLNAKMRFAALQSGEIDVLSNNNTFTLTRDASMGMSQTAVVYYDGQGFMVPKKSNIKSAKQLKGQTVCAQTGTTTEKNLQDFSRINNLSIKFVSFEKIIPLEEAYFSGRCVAYTTDASGLASIRLKHGKSPAEHVILPELISKEPLGPLVKRGDEEWTAIVRWVIYGLIEAEEAGITQGKVDELKATGTDPTIGRLLGTTEDMGKQLGLDKEWLARAIKAVGNYGEVFERNVGPKSPLALPRGMNNLWNKGGIQYAPPIR